MPHATPVLPHLLHPYSRTCYTRALAHATCYTRTPAHATCYMLHPCSRTCYMLHLCSCTCYTRAMHMPHIPPSSLYMGVLPSPYASQGSLLSRLTLDPSRFRNGVSGRKPLRQVSAQIPTSTHPGSQNVYECIDHCFRSICLP